MAVGCRRAVIGLFFSEQEVRKYNCPDFWCDDGMSGMVLFPHCLIVSSHLNNFKSQILLFILSLRLQATQTRPWFSLEY